uniref:Uncharacterized protein n=1 Tax=Leersia perrieri TaxID=77586 RepID=A0A0D9XE98_9ORYZ
MSAGSERAHAFASPSPASAAFFSTSGSAPSSSTTATSSVGRTPSSGPGLPINKKKKRPFRPVADDTKPVLRDPISRSDPVETAQAVLRLPPYYYQASRIKYQQDWLLPFSSAQVCPLSLL